MSYRISAQTVLAVDPGIRGSGVSYFVGDELVRCAYVANPCTHGNDAIACIQMASAITNYFAKKCDAVHRLFFEWPQVYNGRQKGDPNDLLPLVGVCIALSVRLNVPTTHVKPREWKGTQAKGDAFTHRVVSRLSLSEMAAYSDGLQTTSRSLQHNVIDAVGLGLFTVGRFAKKRSIFRGLGV